MMEDHNIEDLNAMFNIFNDDFPLDELLKRLPTTNEFVLLRNIFKPLYRECRSQSPLRAEWSHPMRRLDMLCLHDSGIENESSYTINNWRNRLKDLQDMNIVFQCGTTKAVLFTLQPNIMSWAPFSKRPMLHPQTVLAMLRTRREMYAAIRHKLNKDGKSRVSNEYIYKKLGEFFSEMASKLDPSIMAPLWDGAIDPLVYCEQLKRTLSYLPPLKGCRVEDFDLEAVGDRVVGIVTSPVNSKEFDDLIPENEDVVPSKRPKKVGGAKANPGFNMKMNELDNTPTKDLDLVGEGAFLHILQAFQRIVFPQVGMISHHWRLFQEYGQERMYGDCIRETLLRAGKLNRETVISWIVWYANHKATRTIVNGATCALKLLFSTWEEFRAMSDGVSWSNIASYDDFPEDDSIFRSMELLRQKSTEDRWFVECIMKYGFFMTYAFLLVKTDADLAETELRNYLNGVRDGIKLDEDVRSQFCAALRQTMLYVPPKEHAFLSPAENRLKAFNAEYKEYVSPVLEEAKGFKKFTMNDPVNADFWSEIQGQLNLQSSSSKVVEK